MDATIEYNGDPLSSSTLSLLAPSPSSLSLGAQPSASQPIYQPIHQNHHAHEEAQGERGFKERGGHDKGFRVRVGARREGVGVGMESIRISK